MTTPAQRADFVWNSIVWELQHLQPGGELAPKAIALIENAIQQAVQEALENHRRQYMAEGELVGAGEKDGTPFEVWKSPKGLFEVWEGGMKLTHSDTLEGLEGAGFKCQPRSAVEATPLESDKADPVPSPEGSSEAPQAEPAQS